MAKSNIKEFQLYRDLNIMKNLSCGPTTSDYLRMHVFCKIDGTLPTKRAFNQRMKKLTDEGFVLVQHYGSIRAKAFSPCSSLFILAERGKNEVCTSFSIQRHTIRDRFPASPDLIGHELQVTQIFRIAYNESSSGSYGLEFIYDDRIMRSKYPQNKKGEVHYPDVRLRIIPKFRDPLAINMEVDMGSKNEDHWVRKISSWGDTVLVIAPNNNRLKLLLNAARNTGKRNPVGFALTEDFNRNGFNETKWLWVHSNDRMKLNLK